MTISIKYNLDEQVSIKFDSFNKIIDYNKVVYIYCWGNILTSLPQLPESLQILCCKNNQLSSLPELPNSLKELYCWRNNLNSLPELPNSLQNI